MGGHLWEQLILPTHLRSGEVLLSPANTGPLWVRKQVVVIHDAAALDHPEWFDRRFAAVYRALLPRLAHTVRSILTVSAHSKARLQAHIGEAGDRIQIVYPGVDTRIFTAQRGSSAVIRRRFGIGPRYLLWVGAIEPRKNLPRLLEAWCLASPRLPGVQLVLLGGVRRGTRLIKPPQAAPGAVWTGVLSDSDLVALYSDALALILPSLEEGFGLPVLEALACGAPVIASETIGAREVVGDAALWVNPKHVGEITAAIERISGDEALRQSLSQRGLALARTFTWERAADQVEAALQSAAEDA